MKKRILFLLWTFIFGLLFVFSGAQNVEAASIKKTTITDAIKISATSVSLTWKEVPGSEGYVVYQSTNKKKGFKEVKNINNGTINTCTISKLKKKQTYYYKIKVRMNGKYSGYSKIVSCNMTLPGKVQISSVAIASKKSLQITWKKAYGAKGYVIYRSTNKKKYTKIKTLKSGKSTKYIDSKVKANQTYYYKIQSYSKKGKKIIYSTPSSVKRCKLKRLIKIDKLSISQDSIQTNTKVTVVFSGRLITNLVVKSKSVALYNGNRKVAYLYDNGKNGDEKEGDGIYTCCLNLLSTSEKQDNYRIVFSGTKSSNMVIRYFDPLIANDFKQKTVVQQKLSQIENKYKNGYGYVSAANKAKVLKEVSNYTAELKAKGEIICYQADHDTVWMKMKSGIEIIYMPNIEGVDAVGDNVQVSITTCQPFNTWYGVNRSAGQKNRAIDATDGSARRIDEAFQNYTFTKNYDDGNVNLSKLKEFGANQIILWHGHGGYNSATHSFLGIGEKQTENTQYSDDYISGRVVCLSMENRLGVTYKFFKKYLSSMKNSFVYLATCESGRDSYLANAFLNKGATAVVANSATILTEYNVAMEKSVCEGLLLTDSSGKYFTLSKALAYAKGRHGQNDGTTNKATPKIFGSSGYQLARTATGTLSGQVKSAADRTQVISGAKIEVYNGNKKIKTLTTNSSGKYSSKIAQGNYTLKIKKSGYISFSAYTSVQKNEITYVETFLLVEKSGKKGIASGKITDAMTGDGLSRVKIQFRKGWNNENRGSIVKTVYTSSYGSYDVTLPIGNYTAVMSKSGYVTSSFNIVVQKSATYNQNGSINPKGVEGSYRAVLTWDANPRDIDTHFVGPYVSGDNFHVYYRNKKAYENGITIAALDVDERYGYGPETLTMNLTTKGTYYYYIYLYAGNGMLADSNAKVKLYKGSKLLKTFSVPTNQGNGRYWNVFSITNNKIKSTNTITSSPVTGSVSISGRMDMRVLETIQQETEQKDKK